MKCRIRNCENFSLEVKMNKSSIQKIKEDAYFIIDLPSYVGTIITYDHILANQTICGHEDISYEDIVKEVPQKENQQEEKKL